jgi:hypothetical protein
MDEKFVLEKVGWHTQIKRNYVFDENRMYIMFTKFVHFLQENELTTRDILQKGILAEDETEIKFGDLTEEGFKLFKIGYGRWADNILDKGKSPEDVKYLEKKLKEIRGK